MAIADARHQLTLEPLDDAEYARFAEQQVSELTRQYANAGECPAAECLDRARAACSDLLADRLRGSGHAFLKAVLHTASAPPPPDPASAREAAGREPASAPKSASACEAGGRQTASGREIGWLWIGPPPALVADYGEVNLERVRWLYQITVAEASRGQGYGRALLDLLHARLAASGIQSVYLRVCNWNTTARRLYTGAGYKVVRQFQADAHLRVSLSRPGTYDVPS